MAALSNDPGRCEVLNLGYGPGGHGPYLVRQEGYAPGSTDFKPQRFLLQRDGRWLLNLAFVMLPEAEQEAQLFHSLAEVGAFLDARSAGPVVADARLPAGADPADILAHFQTCTRHLLRGLRDGAVVPLPPR